MHTKANTCIQKTKTKTKNKKQKTKKQKQNKTKQLNLTYKNLNPHNYSDGNMFLRSHADDNLLACNRDHT